MKKTLLFLAITFPLILSAQLTSDDFESYNTGVFDTQWDPGEWVGWFSSFSNSMITDVQANSGSNSLLIEDTGSSQTDIVGLFGEINSGVYELTFMQYIPGDNGAYYNLQHNYTNSAADWAAEIYFSDGISAQAQIITNNTPTIFTASYNEWVQNRYVLNFITETAEFYYNGSLILTWQLSTNASGGPGLNQINGINLYAACLGTGCSSLAYYDDILMEELPLPDYDIAIVDPQRPTGYTIVPEGYVQAFTFETDVANVGGKTVNNIEVTANVLDGGSNLVYTETIGNLDSLTSGSNENFSVASTYVPPASDDYTIEYNAWGTEADENPGDNEFMGVIEFEISDTVYARDDGDYTGQLGFNGIASKMGQNFDFNDFVAIKSIEMSYRGNGVGDTIVGLIYTTKSNGAPNALVASSEPFVLATGGGGTTDVFETLNFTDPVLLDPGNYAFLIHQLGLNNLLLSTSSEIFTPNATWGKADNETLWQTIEDFGFNIAFNVRPIIDATYSDVEELSYVESFTLSPNPTIGNATVYLDIIETKDLMLQVFNIQGQLVHSIRDYDVNGAAQYPLDLNAMPAGVYLIRLAIDDQVISRKLNVTK